MNIETLALALPETAREWLIAIAFLLLTIYWIKTIIEVINTRFSNETNRIVWLLVVIFLYIPGVLLYLMFGKQETVAQS